MKETELAQFFVDYLSCYDLYFEVDYGRCIDIVAINDGVCMAYEVKTSFNFKVLEQAIANKDRFNYSYVCVPDSRDSYFQEQLCKDYGIGLLYYRNSYYGESKIIERVKPKLNRNASAKKLSLYLSDRHKLSKPGAKSGDGEKITAFGVTVENLVFYVKRNNGCTLKDAITNTHHHYRNDTTALRNIYQWIRSGVIKELKFENRKLVLTEKPII
jgi:hypothetical protein